MYHHGNTGAEWTPNKSQHTMLTLEKKILPLLLLGVKLETFWSWVPVLPTELSQLDI